MWLNCERCECVDMHAIHVHAVVTTGMCQVDKVIMMTGC